MTRRLPNFLLWWCAFRMPDNSVEALSRLHASPIDRTAQGKHVDLVRGQVWSSGTWIMTKGIGTFQNLELVSPSA
jgi:hypothetical protein